MRHAHYLVLLALLCFVSACGDAPKAEQWSLLAPAMQSHWHALSIAGDGGSAWADNEITLGTGKPITALRFDAWQSMQLPVTNYAIEFDAMRGAGHDFFAGITFPVRTIDTCATLVLGGWGGGLVGISCIDSQDASENATRSERPFNNDQWYHFRLEVRDDELKGWLDGNLVINTSIKARTISMRIGEIEKCVPFGLATYNTTGSIRALTITKL